MRKLSILLVMVGLVALLSFGCDKEWENTPVGPKVDTVTVFDTTIVVQIDTLVINHYDTTIVVKIDTTIVNHYDTTYVYSVDTVVIISPPDTVIQVIVEHDTTYIPVSNLLYYECNSWRLEWEKWADTIILNNEYVAKGLLGFDRIVLGTKPSGQEPIIWINGEEVFFSVYGETSRMIWIGPMEVPAKAEIVIEFTAPYYGKVTGTTGTMCHDFLKGSHWFIINADSVNYRP